MNRFISRRFLSRTALVLFASSLSGAAMAADYQQQAGSRLDFRTAYLDSEVAGRFAGFQARIRFDPKQLQASSFDVSIPLAQATTDNADYDGELRGGSFFDAGKFPQARFQASAFRALGGNRFAADGMLSLRGIRKPVTLTFTWTPGAIATLSGTAVVKRLDFGVGAGEFSDLSQIPNEVRISTTLKLKPIAAKPAAIKKP